MHTETDAKYRPVDMHVDVPTVANAKFSISVLEIFRPQPNS